MALLAVAVLILGATARRRIITKKRLALAEKTARTNTNLERPVLEKLLLANQELQVLQLILGNSTQNKLTSIDEINSVLGVAKRNADVQKKLRSDCIQSINHNLGLLWGTNEPVIDKTRSEADKRSFEYFVTPKFIEPLGDYVSAHQIQQDGK